MSLSFNLSYFFSGVPQVRGCKVNAPDNACWQQIDWAFSSDLNGHLSSAGGTQTRRILPPARSTHLTYISNRKLCSDNPTFFSQWFSIKGWLSFVFLCFFFRDILQFVHQMPPRLDWISLSEKNGFQKEPCDSTEDLYLPWFFFRVTFILCAHDRGFHGKLKSVPLCRQAKVLACVFERDFQGMPENDYSSHLGPSIKTF